MNYRTELKDGMMIDRITSYNVCYTKLLRMVPSDSTSPPDGSQHVAPEAAQEIVDAYKSRMEEEMKANSSEIGSYNFV